jgi:hypothetical protein
MALTLAFHNWVTLLSIERIGRVYGGGVLKVEPGDAPRILIPRLPGFRSSLFTQADRAFRHGDWRHAVNEITQWLLPATVADAARREWERLRAER